MQLSLLAHLFIGATSIRHRRAAWNTTGTHGQVHGVFPLGSPGPTKPALENPLGGSPCFPGHRTWTESTSWGKWADLATTVTDPFGYKHPEMAALGLNIDDGAITEYECNPPETETPNLPAGAAPWIMHDWETQYVPLGSPFSDLLYNVSTIGVATSFIYDREEAAARVASFDWQLIGSAVDEGFNFHVGRQVSHLMQLPQTGECILTFQGSSSTKDWVANLYLVPGSFCGFGEVAHSGFRNALRAVVQNEDWQSDVLPRLSTCSKVYVTGHSAGGAQAELFTACAHQHLQPGDDGYEEDYKYIGWTL